LAFFSPGGSPKRKRCLDETREEPVMTSKKVVFVAFAKGDEASRDLLKRQSLNTKSPFGYVDIDAEEPYDDAWRTRARSWIRHSDGVVALISKNTPKSDSELWEINCAREELLLLMGIWIGDYRTKPVEMGSARCTAWAPDSIADFIDGL
jgi:hypothetical protein